MFPNYTPNVLHNACFETLKKKHLNMVAYPVMHEIDKAVIKPLSKTKDDLTKKHLKKITDILQRKEWHEPIDVRDFFVNLAQTYRDRAAFLGLEGQHALFAYNLTAHALGSNKPFKPARFVPEPSNTSSGWEL